MNPSIVKEIVMLGAVIVLVGIVVLIAFWFGERNGINKEREYLIDVLKGIDIKSFATDIQYGASVAIGHICDILRKDE